MLPIRITLAGWSTSSVTERSSTSSSPGGGLDRHPVRARRPRPAGPPSSSPCSGRSDCCCSLMPPSSPTAPAQNAWTPRGPRPTGWRHAHAPTATHRRARPGRPRRRLRPDRGVRPRHRRLRRLHPGRDRHRPGQGHHREHRLVRRAGCPRRLRLGASASSAPTRSRSTSTCGRRTTTVSVTRCWRSLEQRAGELAAEAGHAEPWVGGSIYRQDTRTRDCLLAAGFAKQTTFTRMRIDLDPDPPAGAAGVRRDRPPDHRGGRPPGGARDRGGVVPRALRQRADLLRELAGSGSSTAARTSGTSTSPSSTGRRSGCWPAPGSSRRTRTPATCAPSACCPPPAAAGSARRCCATASPARTARAARAVLLHVDVANVTGALRRLRVGRHARRARDRRLGQGRAGRLSRPPRVDADTPLVPACLVRERPTRSGEGRLVRSRPRKALGGPGSTVPPRRVRGLFRSGAGGEQHLADVARSPRRRGAPRRRRPSAAPGRRPAGPRRPRSAARRARAPTPRSPPSRRPAGPAGGGEHRAALAHQQAEVELGLGAALHADHRRAGR